MGRADGNSVPAVQHLLAELPPAGLFLGDHDAIYVPRIFRNLVVQSHYGITFPFQLLDHIAVDDQQHARDPKSLIITAAPLVLSHFTNPLAG